MPRDEWCTRLIRPDDEEYWATCRPCPGCGMPLDYDTEPELYCETCERETDMELRCGKCGFLYTASTARPLEPTCACDSVSQGNDDADKLPF